MMKRTAGPLILTVFLRRSLADQPRLDSPVADTGHIAETSRRRLRVVTPVGIRMVTEELAQ